MKGRQALLQSSLYPKSEPQQHLYCCCLFCFRLISEVSFHICSGGKQSQTRIIQEAVIPRRLVLTESVKSRAYETAEPNVPVCYNSTVAARVLSLKETGYTQQSRHSGLTKLLSVSLARCTFQCHRQSC